MKTTRTPTCSCLSCGAELDAASHPDDHGRGPSPGDVSICLTCGHIMVFADDLTCRNPTDSEMVRIAGDREVIGAQTARQLSQRKRRP